MTKLISAVVGGLGAATILAIVAVGCATAAVIAGAISSNDWLVVMGATGFTAAPVVTAHVVGNQIANATNTTSTTAQPAPAPGPVVVPVPTQGVPAA